MILSTSINFFVVACSEVTGAPVSESRSQDIKRELLMLSVPAVFGQALEPLAQLMETAYIGRLGTLSLYNSFIMSVWWLKVSLKKIK